MTMSVQEAFEKGTQAFNAHDIDEFTGMLTDDAVIEAPGGMRGEGKAACAQYFAAWLGGFSDAHAEVHSVHIAGDVAVEEGTFTGTHNGVLHTPAGDIPPTGRHVRADYIQVVHFRDGKHSSFNLMYDQLEMLEQLGLMPTTAAAG